MDLLLSFSGRANGNCDQIAAYLAAPGDRVIHFRDLDVHPCQGCSYECFHGPCKYPSDDIYSLYDGIRSYDRVLLTVPMYCGSPSSLYFIFHERCQDYFMHNDAYEEIIRRLYIIGVYGSADSSPDFIPCLETWFDGSPYLGHVLGIERHPLGQKLQDSLLDLAEVRERLDRFWK